MTIKDLEANPSEILHASDIAPLLGVHPQSIRAQAQQNVRNLGFPCSVIGTRVLIPKDGFISWWKGDTI